MNTDEAVVISHFLKWVRSGYTGCRFASSLAVDTKTQNKKQRYQIVSLDAGFEPLDIDEAFTLAGSLGRPAIVILPSIETESEIRELSNRLACEERWTSAPIKTAWPGHCYQLCWETELEDKPTVVMGFAPLPTMPVTRSAHRDDVLASRDILEQVVRHKSLFYPSRYAQYEDCLDGGLNLLPTDTADLEADYVAMQEAGMFYGDLETSLERLSALKRVGND